MSLHTRHFFRVDMSSARRSSLASNNDHEMDMDVGARTNHGRRQDKEAFVKEHYHSYTIL